MNNKLIKNVIWYIKKLENNLIFFSILGLPSGIRIRYFTKGSGSRSKLNESTTQITSTPHCIFRWNAEEMAVPTLGGSTYAYDDITTLSLLWNKPVGSSTVDKTTYAKLISRSLCRRSGITNCRLNHLQCFFSQKSVFHHQRR